MTGLKDEDAQPTEAEVASLSCRLELPAARRHGPMWLRSCAQSNLLMDALLCPVLATLVYKVIKFWQYGPIRSTNPLDMLMQPEWALGAAAAAIFASCVMWLFEWRGASRTTGFVVSVAVVTGIIFNMPVSYK